MTTALGCLGPCGLVTLTVSDLPETNMMQSISHWGQFEMQAPGTDHFRERLVEFRGTGLKVAPWLLDMTGKHEWRTDYYDSKLLHGQ